MRNLNPSYKILTPISEGGVNELKMIELAGRQCYKSGDKITEDGSSAIKFVGNLIKSDHCAMIEHGPSLSVMFMVDRGVTHEMVRHRLFSFAQESTRYVNYSKDKYGNEIAVIDIKSGMDADVKMADLDKDTLGAIYDEWFNSMLDAERHYMQMIELGATPQIARSVLPNSTKTAITITGNYREWRHFFKLRCDKAAHPQIREVAIPLLEDLKKRIPVIFDDIIVEDLDKFNLNIAGDVE